MKKIRQILMLALVPLLVAGCSMKVDYGFVISPDKDVTVSITYAYDKEFVDGMISTQNMGEETTEEVEITDEQRWEYVEKSIKEDSSSSLEEGATKKKYNKDGWYGYIYTKKAGTIDNLTKDKADEKNNIFGNDFLTNPAFIKKGDKYISNMTIKNKEGSMDSINQAKNYGAVFDLTMTIELPTKAISNNADKVSADGKTLTWNLTEEKDIDFEFEFKKDKKETSSTDDKENLPLALIIGIAAGVSILLLLALVIVIIVIVVVLKKKKTNKTE